jgi:mersacidin/lichenicidin family type 2 lantibiotic
MSKVDIIRAWKDPSYRASLSAEEREALPAHPAGNVELSDDDMDQVSGGLVRTAVFGVASNGPVIKDTDFCSLACPTNVLCTLNDCSKIGCATAYPNCPIKKLG